MMATWSRLAAQCAAGLLAVALAGCAGPNATSDSDGAEATGLLTLSSLSAPSSLDPAASGNGSDGVYQMLAYEPLINVGPTGDLEPGLATEWAYVGDGNTVLEVTLRDDAKFSDGSDVTADSVAASLNYVAQNGTGPASSAFSTVTAEATGPNTVTLTSSNPNPVLPNLISTHYLAGNIISPAGLADPTALATATFGAGPYVYDPTESVAGDHYAFIPNEHYYDPSRIGFDSVVVKVVSNPTSALQAMKTGQLDFANGDAPTAAAAEEAGLTMLSAPSAWVGAFIIDSDGATVPALASVDVRRALNHAINRTEIAEAVYGGFGSAVSQPNVPGHDAFDESLEDIYPYDIDKAKQLLADAGYPDGFSLRWAYAAYEAQTAQTVEAAAAQLKEAGIDVQLDGATDLGELVGYLTDGEHSLLSLGWGGQSQFANTNQVWLENAQINPHHVVVPGLNEAFEAYAAAPPQNRDAAAQAVQKIIVDEALTLPIARVDTVYFVNPRIKGAQLIDIGFMNNPKYWSE